MREICKAIIDGGAEVAGVAGTSLPGNLNMVAQYGIEPTADEANALMRAAEDYTRTVRAIIHGWIARLPKEENGGSKPSPQPNRRKKETSEEEGGIKKPWNSTSDDEGGGL